MARVLGMGALSSAVLLVAAASAADKRRTPEERQQREAQIAAASRHKCPCGVITYPGKTLCRKCAKKAKAE